MEEGEFKLEDPVLKELYRWARSIWREYYNHIGMNLNVKNELQDKFKEIEERLDKIGNKQLHDLIRDKIFRVLLKRLEFYEMNEEYFDKIFDKIDGNGNKDNIIDRIMEEYQEEREDYRKILNLPDTPQGKSVKDFKDHLDENSGLHLKMRITQCVEEEVPEFLKVLNASSNKVTIFVKLPGTKFKIEEKEFYMKPLTNEEKKYTINLLGSLLKDTEIPPLLSMYFIFGVLTRDDRREVLKELNKNEELRKIKEVLKGLKKPVEILEKASLRCKGGMYRSYTLLDYAPWQLEEIIDVLVFWATRYSLMEWAEILSIINERIINNNNPVTSEEQTNFLLKLLQLAYMVAPWSTGEEQKNKEKFEFFLARDKESNYGAEWLAQIEPLTDEEKKYTINLLGSLLKDTEIPPLLSMYFIFGVLTRDDRRKVLEELNENQEKLEEIKEVLKKDILPEDLLGYIMKRDSGEIDKYIKDILEELPKILEGERRLKSFTSQNLPPSTTTEGGTTEQYT